MTAQDAAPSHWMLIAELVLLFVVLSLAFRFQPFPFPPVPALWLLAGYCLYRLLHDPAFNRNLLWNGQAFWGAVLQVVLVFVPVTVVIGAAVYVFAPHLLFNFVKRAPAFWALVMVLYPVLSVYPRAIIYRAFFFERYHGLFPNSVVLIVMSAVAFSLAHIVFRNPIAILFTLVGGLLFAWRYGDSRSLFTSSV